MLGRAPLDVVLIILRLLPIKDAFAVFATCHQLRASECRSFWVHVNIDMDELPCVPGRPSIDYSTWTTDALRARAIRSLRIHGAWRALDHTPRVTHTIQVSMEYNVARIIRVPWSRLIILFGHSDILLKDWSSGDASKLPLPYCPDVVLISGRNYWVESLNSNVLLLHLLTRREEGPQREIHLFKIDISSRSSSYLGDVIVLDGVIHIDLRGNHLALMSDTGPRIVHIHSFEIRFSPSFSVTLQPTLRVFTMDPVAQSSFLVLSRSRFLVAGRSGISVFEIPEEAYTRAQGLTWWVLPLWDTIFWERDALASPQLGPLLDGGDGTISLSVPGRSYIRFLSIPPHTNNFRITERLLVDLVPPCLGMASGFRVGVYRRPYSMPSFTTFFLGENPQQLHPFSCAEGSARMTGSIQYRHRPPESVEPQSLQMDEGQGLVMFVVRTQSRSTAKVVILELV
ncbi:hypothetical protein B0H17DRAFT_1227875 [Mycena rosella]|uniref:F-box domain-containing protein n=1 Tax=Mycena rosella TaxID=1033263 RepID=A0AAD7D7P9_MYCRO|nr:hypothetical protein B0H17DRAFT_1227875 [Mycena rosella]